VTLISWRQVFLALGVASLALAAAIWLLVRDGPARDTTVRAESGRQRWRDALGTVVRTRGTWPCFWVGFGMSGSYMTFVGLWGVPYLMDAYGRSALEATEHTTVIIVASAASQGLIGALSDRLGRRRPLMQGAALLYLGCWIAWLTGLAALPGASWLICVLTGFTLGGFTLIWSCAKEVNPPRYAGTAISVVNIGGFLAVGILQPLVGWLIDRAAGGAPHAAAHYGPGIALLAACALLGLVAALFIRETHCRNIWTD
jgi:MFS family permease